MHPDTIQHIQNAIRTVPDFPKPGIFFRDITTLTGNADLFGKTIDLLSDRFTNNMHVVDGKWQIRPKGMDIAITGRHKVIDKIAGIDARGFIFGAAMALEIGVGFVPIRKKGKLPGNTHSIKYDLEYGSAEIEVAEGSILPGERVVIVDDLIATGGTALAAAFLVQRCGGIVSECTFVVDIPELGGRDKLEAKGYSTWALCR